GPVGPMGTPGATGAAGPAGPAGPTGATGASGIVTTVAVSGYVGASIAGSATAYVFAGPTAQGTTTAGQRLTRAREAPPGLASGGPKTAFIGLCYQSTAAGAPLINFVGGGFSIFQMTTTRASYAASASVVPGAGTWNVGVCVENQGGAIALTNNDYVNF